MTPEQLQTAYMAGRSHVNVVATIDYDRRKHLAGLAEVARQQAEHDAQIAEPPVEDAMPTDEDLARYRGMQEAAAAILAQFGEAGE